MDIAALSAAGAAVLAALLTHRQGKGVRRADDVRMIVDHMREELSNEKIQRQLLTSYVMDLRSWARRVGPDTVAGPPPEPNVRLETAPWL